MVSDISDTDGSSDDLHGYNGTPPPYYKSTLNLIYQTIITDPIDQSITLRYLSIGNKDPQLSGHFKRN